MRAAIAALLIAAVAGSSPAVASGDWQARTKGSTCFVKAQPVASTNAPPGRGPAYIAVVHNKAERNYDAVSVVSGFPDVTSSNAKIEIEGQSFELLPFNNAAFVRAGKPEQEVLAAMSRPGTMKVVWSSSIDGTTIVDNYSLQGFRESKLAADRACGRPSTHTAAR
ncbi:hypothetical protein [Methylobacterium sp. 092160098-2]|uniref:hypothetical protein n=1 Tax=Methylobacterium sp. 092160098-2 TaxID=3025129 RepID=UPI0023819C7D|nr:hypothetical protein [Methylobacterium sp. 092160098-2]MDE4915049.1 hypothetical protein [Methylobacterium sp. 092160098-2]